MTEKVKNQNSELDFYPEGDNSPFRFKITNLRKNAYPTNTPVETDYHKWKIGDYLVKGNSSNTLYQVVSIIRVPITQTDRNSYIKAINRYGRLADQKAHDLLLEYEKNGNFGICQVGVKAVLRGDKAVAKGRITRFLELNSIKSITYRGYSKVDLPEVVILRDYWIARLNSRIQNDQRKLRYQQSVKQAIMNLIIPVSSTPIVQMSVTPEEVAA